jgi:hypothetical protein
VVELEIDPAGSGDRDPVHQDIGNRGFGDRPHDTWALGPAGARRGGDVTQGDIVPIRGRAGRGRGRIRSGRKGRRVRVPTGQEEGIKQDARHGEIGVGEVVHHPAPVPARLPADAILAPIESAVVHQ